MAGLSIAEDKILDSMETGEVLACGDGLVNVGCGRLVLLALAAQLEVLVEVHIVFKLGLVERPGIGMRVNVIVAGSAEKECFGELPPLARQPPCIASLGDSGVVGHGIDVGHEHLVVVGEIAVGCHDGVVNIVCIDLLQLVGAEGSYVVVVVVVAAAGGAHG